MEATQTLERQVIELIAETVGLNENEIRLDANLVDEYDCDSLDAVELIMAAEETFEVEIDDEDAEKVQTGQDLLSLVERLKG